MISVQEARQIIRQTINKLTAKKMPLQKAVGLVLAEDIHATADFPAFPQSAMDGYAFQYTQKLPPLEVVTTIAAGDNNIFVIEEGTAARIFTGAAIPTGADTVVIQEKTKRKDNHIIIEDPQLMQGANVRPVGSEIRITEMALAKGTILNAGAIGFLAGIGIDEVSVYPPPVIALIVTGNELQTPGKPLEYGQVYESNSATLLAALQCLPIATPVIYHTKDNKEDLQLQIEKTLATCDILLLTGGVSVGEYDFVAASLQACGVQQHFHKIKQKPGKPLWYGTYKQQPVFGLPGNPSSVLTCFYEYVLPAIEQLIGHTRSRIQTLQLPLAEELHKKSGLTHFLKGYCDNKTVTALPAQESYRMRSFATANCLICLEEEKDFFPKGQSVEIHLLPY